MYMVTGVRDFFDFEGVVKYLATYGNVDQDTATNMAKESKRGKDVGFKNGKMTRKVHFLRFS